MTSAQAGVVPEAGTQITVDGQLVTVLAATPHQSGADLVFRRGDGTLGEASLGAAELRRSLVPINDAGGEPQAALTGLWGRWMQYDAVRRAADFGPPFLRQDR